MAQNLPGQLAEGIVDSQEMIDAATERNNFIGQHEYDSSMGSSVQKIMVHPKVAPGSVHGVFLVTIWKKILSYLPPSELVRIASTSSFIHKLLVYQDDVLRQSRILHMPELPPPIPKLSEWEMLDLLYGTGCKVCQKPNVQATTCWSFRTRVCRKCLVNNTKKEHELDSVLMDSNSYRGASDTVPFGMVDEDDHWVPNPAGYKPGIGLTKIFWIPDIIDGYFTSSEDNNGENEVEQLQKKLHAMLLDVQQLEDAEARIRVQIQPTRSGHSAISSEESKPTPEFPQDIKPIPSETSSIPVVGLRPDTSLKWVKQEPDGSYSHKSEKQYSGSGFYKQEHTSDAQRPDKPQMDPHLNEGPPPHLMYLASYAEDVILRWKGRLSPETAAKFSIEVVRHVRETFIGVKPVGRYRLTLEDLKWLFDNKIKPIIRVHVPSMELFLCSLCPDNPRKWVFEPLIQHWCAKHNPIKGAKHAKVDWKQDWPAVGPFRSESSASNNSFNDGANRSEDRRFNMSSHSQPAWKTQSRDKGSENSNYSRREYQEDMANKMAKIAEDAMETWIQYGEIEGLQPSAQLFAVITKAARRYQTRFSEELPLSIFRRAVVTQPELQPLRAIDDLICVLCFKRQYKRMLQESFVSKMYNVEELLTHFEYSHMGTVKNSGAPVDWSREMIKLPPPRSIAGLVDGHEIYSPPRTLLEDIFPWAFASHALQQPKNWKFRSSPYHHDRDHEKESQNKYHKFHSFQNRPNFNSNKFSRDENRRDRADADTSSAHGFTSRSYPNRLRESRKNEGSKQSLRLERYQTDEDVRDDHPPKSRDHPRSSTISDYEQNLGARATTSATSEYPSKDSPLKRTKRASAADFMMDDHDSGRGRKEHSSRNIRPQSSKYDDPASRSQQALPVSNTTPRYRERSRSPSRIPAYARGPPPPPPIPIPPVPLRMDYPYPPDPYARSLDPKHADYPYPKYAGMYYPLPAQHMPHVTPDDYRMAYRSRVDTLPNYYESEARMPQPARAPNAHQDPSYRPPPPPPVPVMGYPPRPPYMTPAPSHDPRYDMERDRYEREYYARRGE
ncbi:hypothetical protein EX30DRAFT_398581 [Ascodesmis nigricans]|uniref:DUF7892 domain-containing protein n=1 Tax=Ascodesmis nigricans TaxID=341454 RepID=A0A4S2MPY3_9PEZI|nr:hypothetical protein EX30DRAFT_398581 [Ascodesmis nigricans]